MGKTHFWGPEAPASGEKEQRPDHLRCRLKGEGATEIVTEQTEPEKPTYAAESSRKGKKTGNRKLQNHGHLDARIKGGNGPCRGWIPFSVRSEIIGIFVTG